MSDRAKKLTRYPIDWSPTTKRDVVLATEAEAELEKRDKRIAELEDEWNAEQGFSTAWRERADSYERRLAAADELAERVGRAIESGHWWILHKALTRYRSLTGEEAVPEPDYENPLRLGNSPTEWPGSI